VAQAGRRRVTAAEPDQAEFVFTSYRAPRPTIYRPMGDRTRYFILTSAQDSSKVHESFWRSLQTYAEWLENCEIIVSGFTYSKRLFEDHDTRSPKVGFHPLIDDYITTTASSSAMTTTASTSAAR
jgi:hypothetical protein